MKPTVTFSLLVGLLFAVSGCLFNADPDYSYPPSDRSKLKGPRSETLDSQTFSLKKTLSLPFQGYLKQFGSRYILEEMGVGQGNIQRRAVIDGNKLYELRDKPFYTIFLDEHGDVWGLSLAQNSQDSLYQYQNNQWNLYTTLSLEKYYAYLLSARNDQFVFNTNEGVVFWDVKQKKRAALLSKDIVQLLTDSYQVGFDGRSVIISDANSQRVLHKVKAGYQLWDAFEDDQQRLWFVVRDKNWDGLLYQYDGKTSRLLTTIPVGSFDSGRNVGSSTTDKAGNFWLMVDNYYSVYTAAGKWVKPVFPAPYDKLRLTGVFKDQPGNLVGTDGAHFYDIN